MNNFNDKILLNKIVRLVVVLFFISQCMIAQSELKKWIKLDATYETEQPARSGYIIKNKEAGSLLLSVFKITYNFLISDLDGDNCPFYPTCSQFFIQSVEETNLVKGALMFADRFTRDTNIFKRYPYYPLHKSGRLYDPVHNYKLNFSDVVHYPGDIVVQ
ncbi:MAG: membrane protein insertion efficiency factor YidD [Melioribacteraceae bacterium]|nr:membrane protein insertion efficiency factor YidD [Melioribacteraceae bacterium]